jgi:uncharacterized protein
MSKTLPLVALLVTLSGCAHAAPAATTVRPVVPVVQAAKGPATATGIALDAPWKAQEYAFAVKTEKHPSWGLSHGERDLRLALEVAAQEGLVVDKDVLFAAAYLHDLGGLDGYSKPGVDHAVRSAEVAEPLLKGWGFPMEKFPKVKEVILGHVYYGAAPEGPEARAFHDADLLDFLGPMGVSRLLAATQDGGPEGTMGGSLKTARAFAKDLPGKLTTGAARELAKVRVAQMQAFFQQLDAYTYDGKAF